MLKNYRESLAEEMKNPEFVKEWNALEDEFKNKNICELRANRKTESLQNIDFRKYASAAM